MRDWLFFSRRPNHWEDGWTYGDWRQYVALRPDGSLQCCRVSSLPNITAIGGVFALLPALFGLLFTLQGVEVYWGRAAWVTAIGVVMVSPAIISMFSPWVLMTAVGPRQYDGWRILPGEEKP